MYNFICQHVLKTTDLMYQNASQRKCPFCPRVSIHILNIGKGHTHWLLWAAGTHFLDSFDAQVSQEQTYYKFIEKEHFPGENIQALK